MIAGSADFLAGPTANTIALNEQLDALMQLELKKGVLDVDPTVPSTITAFGPGYLDKNREVIVGMQCDAPFKRAIKPLGGTGMVRVCLFHSCIFSNKCRTVYVSTRAHWLPISRNRS